MFCEVLESLGPNRGQRLSVVSEALITSIMVVIKEYSITYVWNIMRALRFQSLNNCRVDQIKVKIKILWNVLQPGP